MCKITLIGLYKLLNRDEDNITEQKDDSFAGKAPNISFHKSWMEYHVRTKIRRTLRKSKLYIHKENLTVIKLFRVSAQVTGALKSILGIHSQSCFRDTHVDYNLPGYLIRGKKT